MEIKSSSISHIEIKSISTTHAKTKSSSMLTLQPSDFWPAYKKPSHLQPPTQNQVNPSTCLKQLISHPSTPIPALKTSQFRSIHENQVNSDLSTEIKWSFDFDHPCRNEVKFDAYNKQSDFRPAYKNRVDIDHPHKN